MNDLFGDHRHKMQEAVDGLNAVLDPFTDRVASDIPSYEGVIVATEDRYHTDSVPVITAINVNGRPRTNFDFQTSNVDGYRVDLEASALGDAFHSRDFRLTESYMNPEKQLVAGIYLPEKVGKYATSVYQLAFTKGNEEPSQEQLDAVLKYWDDYREGLEPHLTALERESVEYPNGSVGDALLIAPPTIPNAMVCNWDLSGSTEKAMGDYPSLRNTLTLLTARFSSIIQKRNGKILFPTGDGQTFAFEIPPISRLSTQAMRRLALSALVPTLHDMAAVADYIDVPVRIAAELGRVEDTTLDKSGRVFYETSIISQETSRAHTAISLGDSLKKLLFLA